MFPLVGGGGNIVAIIIIHTLHAFDVSNLALFNNARLLTSKAWSVCVTVSPNSCKSSTFIITFSCEMYEYCIYHSRSYIVAIYDKTI